MQWVDINWEHKQWRIPDTKNGEPVTIPLTETALNILTKRKATATGPWVFPSEHGGVGHYVDPKRAWQRIREKTTLAIWELIPEVAEIVVNLRKKLKDEAGEAALTDEEAWRVIYRGAQKEAKTKGIELPPCLLDLRIHDIRRTVGSYQAITGASMPIIGKSLGHKSQISTQIYARLHLEPVRDSLEKAQKAMLLSKE